MAPLMRILIACERFGAVRDEFRERGHEAFSNDLPGIEPEGKFRQYHIAGDALDIIRKRGPWDAIIAFPPCTYLTSSGLHWNKRRPDRAAETEKALVFVDGIMRANCENIVVENPRGCITTRLIETIRARGFMRQSIQPNQFGEDASKETVLLIRGFRPLKETERFPGRLVEWPKGSGRMIERWSNQTDSGQNRLGPSADRAIIRGKTYPGIARAMAEQWGAVESSS